MLIICPRPLVVERKWELEMKRFDEDFTKMDGKALSEAISETDRDGEWPERHRKTIIPYSLFSEDSIMGRQSTSDKKKKSMGLQELGKQEIAHILETTWGRNVVQHNPTFELRNAVKSMVYGTSVA